MRSFIPIVSFALLLSSCGGEDSTPPSTSQSASSPPASAPLSASDSSETEPASTEGQSVAPASGTPGPGDPTEGETLFNQRMIAGTPGCVVCHSLEPGVRMVGPSMANAATVAATAVEGMSAEDFLRQSIVEPDAYVTEGFIPGLMFQDYGDNLSSQQIDDLVAFLMTQT